MCKRLCLGLFFSGLLYTAVVPACAQDDLRVLPLKGDGLSPRKMLTTYQLAAAQKHFDARRLEISELKTPDDIRKRQESLKVKLSAALGGFPEKTPLNPRVVAVEQRDGYRIEKVLYESRPLHHVSATLYLPDGQGPFPGVLMPIGHSSNGKAAEYIQRGCILLAKNGLAALTYDPIGQGERRQLLDSMGKPALPSSTTEHTLIGVGALLVGQNTATYRIWDGIRSLDYLASRSEIDPKRLGCTGCSGGGTLTAYLMALDDRIVVAAPSCYITSLERLFATIGPQDAEQNITGQVALHIEHADYLTMRAPRPTLLCAATQDFFDIQGTWTTFREATLLYGMLGHSEHVSLVEYNTKHGYPRPQREAVVRWMRRWLLHRDEAIVEPPFAIAKDKDLQCTRSGEVLADFKGKSAFTLNAERAEALAKKRRLTNRSPAELAQEVRRLIALPARIPPAQVKDAGAVSKQGHSVRKVIFETEPDISVPGLHFVSAKAAPDAPVVVYVDGLGMAAAAAPGGPIEALLQKGNQVLALDLRGMGETAPGVPSAKPGFFGTDFRDSFLGLHLNRPLLGQRAYDLLAVVAWVKAQPATAKAPLHVLATGSAGPIALHAAALEPRIDKLTLHGSLLSWMAVVRSPISYNQLTNVVPNALAVYDLPDLAALIAPRPLTLHGMLDAKLEAVAQSALEQSYAGCANAYDLQQARKSLVLQQ